VFQFLTNAMHPKPVVKLEQKSEENADSGATSLKRKRSAEEKSADEPTSSLRKTSPSDDLPAGTSMLSGVIKGSGIRMFVFQ
jgi:hypothetical protein